MDNGYEMKSSKLGGNYQEFIQNQIYNKKDFRKTMTSKTFIINHLPLREKEKEKQ